MNYLKEIIKGILIGVACVTPGISGGIMAVSMGIYDKIIYAVNNVRKEFMKSFKTLLPYGIGAVIGIACLSFMIEILFANYEIPTLMTFLGLILGGLLPIIKRVEKEKFKYTHFISFIIFALLIIVPTVLSGKIVYTANTSFNFISIFILFLLGVISAGSIVVPGISGSMILMMVGYYEVLIRTINEFIKSVLYLNWNGILSSSYILMPFGIGMVLGVFIIAKIIGFLLKRYPNATYWGIIGLVAASPFAILYDIDVTNIGMEVCAISIVAFIIGFILAKKLSE